MSVLCFIVIIIVAVTSSAKTIKKAINAANGKAGATTNGNKAPENPVAVVEPGLPKAILRLKDDLEDHTHNRITGYEDNSCSPEEHWEKQLKIFLKNGIIEREEYNTLLHKYWGGE